MNFWSDYHLSIIIKVISVFHNHIIVTHNAMWPLLKVVFRVWKRWFAVMLSFIKSGYFDKFSLYFNEKNLGATFQSLRLRACWRRVYARKGRERDFQGERRRNSFGHQKFFVVWIGGIFLHTAAILTRFSLIAKDYSASDITGKHLIPVHPQVGPNLPMPRYVVSTYLLTDFPRNWQIFYCKYFKQLPFN